MTVSHGSHHTWGHIGYYLSALYRFRNAVGHTPVHHNPDSWEGWYWGAAHHWGYTLRVGQCETYGTVEDLLQELRDGGVLGGRSRHHQRLLWRAGRHGAPAVAEEARHQGRAHRSLLQFVRPVPAGQMDLPEADDVAGARHGDRLRVDQGRAVRQGIRRDAHGRLRRLEGLYHGRAGRRAQDARMAGEGNRRSRQGRARAGARMGAQSAPISAAAAGATATAAPAATRPASSGRAPWCA